jgi:hypothetical protein
MVAAWTEERKGTVTIPMIKRACLACKREFEVKEHGKGSSLQYCSVRCHMLFDNPMKSIILKIGQSRAAKHRSPETLQRLATSVSEAHARGDFTGVRLGKCHWYEYKGHKVQGTWELAFVHWLCERRMKFTAHRGSFKYIAADGQSRYWLPDFHVEDWNAWVDVKGDHWYDPEKFRLIGKANPSINVVVLLRKNLTDLGVKIYGTGNKHLPYLSSLIQRCRIQPRVGK